MSAKDADDAGDAGDVVHYGHPPKNTRFLTPRGDAQKAAKNRLNKSGNPSPLIRVGPAWRSAKVRIMVPGGRRHRAAGLIPEGRPCGPRPSAVSRTTGSEAPRWPDLRAAAQCRRPLRWGPAQVFFVLAAAFGWFRLAGLLACSLA